MKFLTQWLLVFLTVLNPIFSSAALTDFDRQELPVKNWLAPYNSGFESSKAKWTASGGTFAAVTSGTNLLVGKGSATWDGSSASQTLTSQTITIEKGYYGQNCEAGIVAQVPSGTATHTVQAYDGTNILVSATIVSSTTPRLNTVNFPCPQSGTVALRLVTVASDEPLIAIDDAYLGLARNVGGTQLISEWTSYTPTGSWTTNTTYTGRKRRVGDSAEYDVLVSVSGAPTAAALTINNSSECVTDTTKISGGTVNSSSVFGYGRVYDNGTALYKVAVQYESTTAVRPAIAQDTGSGYIRDGEASVNSTTPMTFASGDNVHLVYRVPCVGWTAQTTASIDAISKRGSIYFSTGSSATTTSGSAVTFNNAAFSTYTAEGQALAPTTANDIGIRMTGAPAGVYEVNLVGWLYAYRASGETGTNCAYDLYDGTNSRGGAVAGAPNVSGVSTLDGISTLSGTFTLSSAGTINVVLRGQRTAGTGTCYAGGPVSISIKNVSQQSPAIVLANSVSSGITQGRYFDTATVLCSSSSSITRDLGGVISSIGNISSGTCSLTLATGKFSAAPDIVTTLNASAANDTKPAANCTSATACTISYYCSGAACTSAAATVFLSGPR